MLNFLSISAGVFQVRQPIRFFLVHTDQNINKNSVQQTNPKKTTDCSAFSRFRCGFLLKQNRNGNWKLKTIPLPKIFLLSGDVESQLKSFTWTKLMPQQSYISKKFRKREKNKKQRWNIRKVWYNDLKGSIYIFVLNEDYMYK